MLRFERAEIEPQGGGHEKDEKRLGLERDRVEDPWRIGGEKEPHDERRNVPGESAHEKAGERAGRADQEDAGEPRGQDVLAEYMGIKVDPLDAAGGAPARERSFRGNEFVGTWRELDERGRVTRSLDLDGGAELPGGTPTIFRRVEPAAAAPRPPRRPIWPASTIWPNRPSYAQIWQTSTTGPSMICTRSMSYRAGR